MIRRIVAAAATSVAALAVSAPALATTYYVSPSGSDAGAGTSQAAAWRSVSRVSSAALAPGDTVLFDGSGTYPGLFQPSRSGAAGAPITFRSYGSGRANLSGGIQLASRS